ncbi:MAG: 4Fe-4S dicluster domain-containing protein [Coriobacteriia bacterium]
MQYVIVTELNRCVGCFTCSVACKAENNVPIGSFWNKVMRVGPTPIKEGDKFPDVEMYFLPVTCQHCENPECVKVCPTGASHKKTDGTVQVDKEKCIGCQFCVMACPYGVRYLNEEAKVVEKCTMCEHLTSQGEDPECVTGCVGLARHFGDIDDPNSAVSKMIAAAGDRVYKLKDVGNHPSNMYILNKHTWRG